MAERGGEIWGEGKNGMIVLPFFGLDLGVLGSGYA
jgi:hypothetical protein